ncbi:unnamed protein product [Cylicostephanus goldi]|uniref:F-box domain-containing protein n=1 Tax=Cylicostephanus goldi TaxID=71465 RepID=A0A3P6SY28_CYLGO|nr:unnamed protein product [Cylicostephanus goldi]
MNEKSISNLDVDWFEDHFTYWNRLPMELKLKVVRNLPYPTLRNFMFLSKECMKVSSLLRASVYEVALVEEPYMRRNRLVEEAYVRHNRSSVRNGAQNMYTLFTYG